jgi:hypothetical protein
MHLAELQKKLIHAARQQPPDERVPYAFEKRILALIAERAAANRRVFWERGLWSSAVSCVALALICGAVSWFTPERNDSAYDLSQDLETTLLASADIGEVPQP